MSTGAVLSPDGATLTVSVPLVIRRRGGRRQLVLPSGAPGLVPSPAKIDSTPVKALARAFGWRRLLEEGVHASCGELAAAERINGSYISRVLRLTLLAPEFVEAILDGRHSPELTLARLFRPFPVKWEEQQEAFAAR